VVGASLLAHAAAQAQPGSAVMNSDGTPWTPDLVQGEPRFTLALLVKL